MKCFLSLSLYLPHMLHPASSLLWTWKLYGRAVMLLSVSGQTPKEKARAWSEAQGTDCQCGSAFNDHNCCLPKQLTVSDVLYKEGGVVFVTFLGLMQKTSSVFWVKTCCFLNWMNLIHKKKRGVWMEWNKKQYLTHFTKGLLLLFLFLFFQDHLFSSQIPRIDE